MDRAQETEMLLNATGCAAIMRAAERYRLVELDSGSLPSPESPEWKGAEFCGCIAVAHGRVSVSLDCAISPEDLRRVVTAFGQLIGERAAPKGDSADWLERLGRLPDTRG